jgi:hypothetical protein
LLIMLPKFLRCFVVHDFTEFVNKFQHLPQFLRFNGKNKQP